MSQIDRCFDILELLFRNPKGLSLSEIGQASGIPLATAHRMLSLIKERGYIAQDHREQYYLSLLLPSMGKNFLASTGFSELIQPLLDRIAEDTGEHVRLAAVLDNQLVWVLRSVVSRHGLQYRGKTETQVVPHITASGKVWLSTLSDEEVVQIISEWDVAKAVEYGGPNATTSVKGLFANLREARKLQYAAIEEEAEVGVAAVAVGIYDNNDASQHLLGTLSIAGPSARLGRDELGKLAENLKSAARGIQDTWSMWASGNANYLD